MSMADRNLGTLRSAELLLKELYVDLRRNVRAWSAITRQTPQARMGYVGQHLVSVVTGFPGGRSGARGHDLTLPNGHHAEIKTCYRIDQLGQCANCGAAVSSIEDECPECRSTTIIRKDDSKWLISIRNDEEMKVLFRPLDYYLVLFDFSAFVQLTTGNGTSSTVITKGAPEINARIWQVDPNHPGFALCMVDYYVNIRANSTSKAPFNFWPYSLKFQLMQPRLIYHALIEADDSIRTLIFRGTLGTPEYYPVAPFPEMVGSRQNLTNDKLRTLCARHNVELPERATRTVILQQLQDARISRGWDDAWVAAELAELMYRDRIRGSEGWLPPALQTPPRL